MIAPGSTIGILGGGQLGRMLAVAAAQLGYRTHIYAPEASGPATEVAADWTQAGYDDGAALDAFAAAVDVVTYEFENVPVEAVARLGALVRPGARSLEVSQDRLNEKRFVERLGGAPAPWRAVDSRADLDLALAEIGPAAILKTRRFGYDGKGQARLTGPADADAAWAAVNGAPSVLEGLVPFDAEFSVILARGGDGTAAVYHIPENRHDSGILARSEIPAGRLVAGCADAAVALTRRIADELGHVGILACEFFACPDGPVFNEMAPRVHNSGHWTIEGAAVSQFENHIRAICGLPLGSTGLTAPSVTMQNLIGNEVDRWPELLADPRARLHLYGKRETLPGRKMGHVTWL